MGEATVFTPIMDGGNTTDASVKSDTAGGRYDLLTRLLHWIFAVIIIYASIIGSSLKWIDDQPLHDSLSHLNMSLCTLLIFLFPLRLAWKFMRTNPPAPAIDRKLLKVAHSVHNLLYLAIFSVLVSGILMTPNGYMFFGLCWIPTPYEKGAMTELFARIHTFSTMFLSGLVILHMLGVINHMAFKRINILRRML